MVTYLTALDILSLCEAGRYQEAKDALPHKSDDPEVLLVYGMVESAAGSPERAKDHLSKAIRMGGLCASQVNKCKTQLALAYWRCGEKQEAITILKTAVPCFDSFLIEAIIEAATPRRALELLDQAATFTVSVGSEGRLHNQRAMALKTLKETDRAIQEYEAAVFCFENAESYDCLAYVTNNLAGLYISCGHTDKAHEYIDRVIPLLPKDSPQVGKCLDQKASAFLVEKNFTDAELFARRALKVIKATEYKGWYGECLLTYARALGGLRKFTEAFSSLDQAKDLATYLGNEDLLFDALRVQFEMSKEFAAESERRLIESVLATSSSLRAAAARVGISHPLLLQRVAKHGLKSTFKPRRSLL